MLILIDGRLYGLENAGLGRYLMNLISELGKIDNQNSYVLLLRKKYFDNLKLPGNWKKVLADFRHYSFEEQIILPKLIEKEKPDITHFPHFNASLLYRRKYIVTIHDMLMHKFAGISATTLPAPFYFLKQIIYKFVFRNAVLRASKIIVPSGAVKDEILNYYHLKPEKIEVIYE